MEAAFRKFDKNEDGFLDWAEFQQVNLKLLHENLFQPFFLGIEYGRCDNTQANI